MHKSRGFTLIELMIAVAVISILAAVGYPSYVAYIQRGRISEAISILSNQRVKMEQVFQDNRTYVGACTQTTYKYFILDCLASGTATYSLGARGIPGSSMEGFNYTIDQNGNKTSTFTAPANWPNSTSCWVLKKDGSC